MMFLVQWILKEFMKEVFMKTKQDNKEKTSHDEKYMNIAYTVDIQGIGAQQFADQLYVSISSLRKSKKDTENIRVHIFYGNIK